MTDDEPVTHVDDATLERWERENADALDQIEALAGREGYPGWRDHSPSTGPTGESPNSTGERPDVYPLLTGEDLLNQPPPSWLLEGILPSAGLSVLYGASGTGKSFLALDWALCVAAGVPWHGREVEQRWVVYVAAEGKAGLGARYRAWLEARGLPRLDRVRFLTDAVNLLDEAAVARVRRTLATLPEGPVLLVVDTMARTMVGGDENSARDVGLFVHAVDTLRDGGETLVVHHTGHEGDRERGSSALRGAADARLQLVREGRTRTLSNPKQKEGVEHDPIDLWLEPCAGSMVLSLVTSAEAEAQSAKVDEAVFAVVLENAPASKRAVRDGVRRGGLEVGNNAIDASLKRLVGARRIVATRKGRGDGYEACPDPSGTLGHGHERSPGGSVPGEGEAPVGGPPSGTLRDPAVTTVPAGVPGASDGDLEQTLGGDSGATGAADAPLWCRCARPLPAPGEDGELRCAACGRPGRMS